VGGDPLGDGLPDRDVIQSDIMPNCRNCGVWPSKTAKISRSWPSKQEDLSKLRS
jgi:hypothetical protein